MRSFIFSECRDFRTGVIWEDFGFLVTARAREFWMFWSFFLFETVEDYSTVSCSSKFRMNDRSGDGTGSFEVKISNADSR